LLLVFGNGQKLSLTPENYLFRVGEIVNSYLFKSIEIMFV